MNVTAESYGHCVVLNIKGELTTDSITALSQAADHQLTDSDVIDIILNLQNVPFIDSASLEYLLSLRDALADRLGRVKLIHVSENLRLILRITRLISEFDICQDAAEAIKMAEV